MDSGIDHAVTAVDHSVRGKRRRDQLLTITGNRFPWRRQLGGVQHAAGRGLLVTPVQGDCLDDIIEDERFIDLKGYKNMSS